ncbi:MAG: hypothetical protein AB7P76_06450 [Candidatus Melainabacteria bacterium]
MRDGLPSTEKPGVVWGVIPSRRDSRRLPGKAILPVNGEPMIHYTFQAALACDCLDRCLVYSDDPGVLALACDAGIELPPVDRPPHISGDASTTDDTLRALLNVYPRKHWPDTLVLLQPTSPLRVAADIESALAIYAGNACDAVVSVHRPAKPLSWTYWRLAGELLPAFAEDIDLVMPNGAVYVGSTARLMAGEPLVSGRVLAHEMPWHASVDVDTLEDLLIAETLLRARGVTGMPLPGRTGLAGRYQTGKTRFKSVPDPGAVPPAG